MLKNYEIYRVAKSWNRQKQLKEQMTNHLRKFSNAKANFSDRKNESRSPKNSNLQAKFA